MLNHASGCAGGTVLIVDDDPGNRLLAKTALEQSGLSVVETDDGAKAVEIWERVNPDLILLDVRMPGTDSLMVCRRIREHPEGWHLPILIMTVLDDVDSIEKAYEIGATDFIGKPCNWRVLNCRVRYLLRSSRTLRELCESRTNLNQAQHLARIGSWEWDVINDVLHWSEEVYRIFDLDPVDFDKTYQTFVNSVHATDRESVHLAFEGALENNKNISIDHNITISDGTSRCLHTEAKVVRDKAGRPVRIAGTVQDITERKQYEEQIRRLAYYDSLTGLPNRMLFRENLSRAIRQAEKSGLRVATCFLDMDRFKEVNDHLGHDCGDKLLQDFADRLTNCVRRINRKSESAQDWADSPIARLGGDEFTIILGGISRIGDAAKAAQRIIENLAAPYNLDGHHVSVTVSLGISIFPDDGRDMITLLKCADIAMYRAKNQGRNRFSFYEKIPNA